MGRIDNIKRTLILKTVFVFLLFIMTICYLAINANLNLINIKLYQSLILFRNDLNRSNNIIEYIALHIIKLIFDVDIHNLQSFFDNINPIFKKG